LKILLVDDETLQLIRLDKAVRECAPDAEISAHSDPRDALESAKRDMPDVAFLDIAMGGMSGMELAKKLKALSPTVNIVFVTGYLEYAIDAHALHVSGYVTKPVTPAKIEAELENLRHPIPSQASENRIRVRCFGNFEAYANGEPIKFGRRRTKELLAYLVDRHGAACGLAEINAALWDDDKSSYLRMLIVDLKESLEAVGAGDVFVKRFNECYIIPEKIDCDYYDYEKDAPYAVKSFHGEYMNQYSWAEGKAQTFMK